MSEPKILIDTDKILECTICGTTIMPEAPKVIQGLVRRKQIFKIAHEECWEGAERMLEHYSFNVREAYKKL